MIVDTPKDLMARRVPGGSGARLLSGGICNKDVPARQSGNGKAFSLVELLMVLTIIIVMLALAIPAFNTIKGAGDVTKAVCDISGALEQARTYAMANNTYVWVGFYEEDGSRLTTSPVTPGIGRVVISIVASKDGTSYSQAQVNQYPKAFGAGDPSNQVSLIAVNKPVKIDNIHLGTFNDGLSDRQPEQSAQASCSGCLPGWRSKFWRATGIDATQPDHIYLSFDNGGHGFTGPIHIR